MRAVAEHAIGAVLAAAEIDGAGFFCCVGNGGEVGAFVRAVTEWLRLAFTTGAPVVGLAGDDRCGNGGFLSDGWLGHGLVG